MIILIVGANTEQSRITIRKKFPVIIDNPTDGLRLSKIPAARDYITDLLESLPENYWSDPKLVIWSNDEWIINRCFDHGIYEFYDVDGEILKRIDISYKSENDFDGLKLSDYISRNYHV